MQLLLTVNGATKNQSPIALNVMERCGWYLIPNISIVMESTQAMLVGIVIPKEMWIILGACIIISVRKLIEI